MQRAACACTDQCSGIWDVHWETVDLAQMLREGDVHLASTSRLHSTEMQTLGGSQAEIPYSVLFLLAPQAAEADQDISLECQAQHPLPLLSPAGDNDADSHMACGLSSHQISLCFQSMDEKNTCTQSRGQRQNSAHPSSIFSPSAGSPSCICGH